MSPRPKETTLPRAAVTVVAFACLAGGAWLITPAAGLLMLGAVLWLDLQLEGPGRRAKR